MGNMRILKHFGQSDSVYGGKYVGFFTEANNRKK